MGARGLQAGELTERKKCFAFEYAIDFHGTNAAIRAGYTEGSAAAQASILLKDPKIQELIEEHKARRARVRQLNVEWVLDQWMLIAQADPNDLVNVRIQRCKQCWPHLPAGELPPNPECKKCDGAGERMEVCITETRLLKGAARRLYAGAKQTKDGIEIKMRDQDGALGKLANWLGMEKNDQRIQAMVTTLTAEPKELSDADLMRLASANIPEPEGGTNGGTPLLP